MANRSTHPISTPRNETELLFATLTGGGAATALAMTTQEAANGEISSAAHAGSNGLYTIVFRHKYPVLKRAPNFSFVGATDGLNGHFTAIDVAAGTGTVQFCASTTPIDIPTTTTVYIDWVVRNSAKNP